MNVDSTPGSNVLTLSTTASDADPAQKALTLQIAAYREVRSSRLNAEIGTQRGLTEQAGKDLDRQISSTSQILEALDGTGKQQSSTLAAKLAAFFERKIDNTTNLRGLDAVERSGPTRLAEAGSVQNVEGTSPTVPAALGLAVGAVLGACLAIALSVLQDRVSDRLDVAEALPNAPVLAESRRGRTGPGELEKVARGIARSRPLDGARRVAIVPGRAERLAAVASGLAEALQVEMGQRATVLVVTDPQQIPPGDSDEGDRGDVAVMLVSAGRDSRRSVVSLADRLHVSGVPLAGVVLLDVRPADLCAAPRKSRY